MGQNPSKPYPPVVHIKIAGIYGCSSPKNAMYRYWPIPIPIGSMVLVYMLTSRGYIDGIHVTIYSSTMDPMGYLLLLHGAIFTSTEPLVSCSARNADVCPFSRRRWGGARAARRNGDRLGVSAISAMATRATKVEKMGENSDEMENSCEFFMRLNEKQ